jgi:hypothetical protein
MRAFMITIPHFHNSTVGCGVAYEGVHDHVETSTKSAYTVSSELLIEARRTNIRSTIIISTEQSKKVMVLVLH